ncbi:hypothetical protein SAMN02745673_01733 [Marinactinospora thermotolerans DSM 45154]|uniref:Uncharacterized protein n=1 Tax=Marinactinospora thermotolerans DSM 45154 TaxID=1122192 RepID=A0A1T4PBW6_9ACTN|nr:hypothetical protein [Marinactinospora thermotolerans]SJZ89065.1 hypothetical protein SAMN02745673_01733 [Marinactinospora thermotolerans DSM 45154]
MLLRQGTSRWEAEQQWVCASAELVDALTWQERAESVARACTKRRSRPTWLRPAPNRWVPGGPHTNNARYGLRWSWGISREDAERLPE